MYSTTTYCIYLVIKSTWQPRFQYAYVFHLQIFYRNYFCKLFGQGLCLFTLFVFKGNELISMMLVPLNKFLKKSSGNAVLQ